MKKVLTILLTLFFISANVIAQSDIVYITKTGSKYHRITCSSLRSSAIEITKDEAISRGYTACKRCRP